MAPVSRKNVHVHHAQKGAGVGLSPIRFAIVGLGYWGPNLVRNLHELPGAEAVVVCDLEPQALESIARRYPAIETTTCYADVLADDRIDAVVIATPVSTHFPLADAALDAGKHVFIEKPLAASSAEAEALIAKADEANLVLMPGHTFLYSPAVMMIRDLIASGELGEIYFISTSRVNLGLHQSDVSVAWDLGPHDFSILHYWLGETPTHASALSRGCIIPTIPDVAFIDLEFPSGTVAHVELSWLAPSKLRRTTIVGSRKMIVYDDTSPEPVRVFDSGAELPNPESFGEYKLTYRTGDIVSPRMEVAEPLFREMDDFCTAIRTGSVPRSSAQLGLEVVRMIEAVDASLELDGARVGVEAELPMRAVA
jgi:predicted dehydrogenase